MVTIFTPTYNRAYILQNLYDSLKKQTVSSFEWLIIDDGSIDGTEELIKKWRLENNTFSIRYYYFQNSGKQKEINRALDLAFGDLFLVVDSDDQLTPNAIELIYKWEKSVSEKGGFCGFAGSAGDYDGNPTNPLFESEYMDVSFFNRYPKCKPFIGHDRPWVFYTDIHRQYKYPEFEGEKFITEAVVWNRMANDGYKIRCYNDVIYLWEHQEGGLTNEISQILVNNPKGFGLWRKELAEYLQYGIKDKIKMYYSFYCDEKDICSMKKISDYIGCPKLLMKVLVYIYRLRHR